LESANLKVHFSPWSIASSTVHQAQRLGVRGNGLLVPLCCGKRMADKDPRRNGSFVSLGGSNVVGCNSARERAVSFGMGRSCHRTSGFRCRKETVLDKVYEGAVVVASVDIALNPGRKFLKFGPYFGKFVSFRLRDLRYSPIQLFGVGQIQPVAAG